MKVVMRFMLLFLWLSAIVTPNIVTLLDVDNPVTVLNLNDEEEQEAGKKNQDEEQIFTESLSDFSLIAKTSKITSGILNFLGHKEYFTEILLPPPRPMG